MARLRDIYHIPIAVISGSNWNSRRHYLSRPPAYFTWNTTVAFASIHRETSRQIFNNGYSTDYVLSTVCEFVSRRLPVASTSPAFYRTFWNPHRDYWSSQRERFTLASHSFAIQIPLILLLRFIRPTSIYFLHTIVHQTQLLVMGLQLGTATGTY